ETNVPQAAEGANAGEPDRPGPRREIDRRNRVESMATPVRLQAEQQLKQQHRSPGSPRLRACGRRIRNRERGFGPAHAGEDLRELVTEVLRGSEHPLRDALSLRP